MPRPVIKRQDHEAALERKRKAEKEAKERRERELEEKRIAAEERWRKSKEAEKNEEEKNYREAAEIVRIGRHLAMSTPEEVERRKLFHIKAKEKLPEV